jgi:hypothetical protein
MLNVDLSRPNAGSTIVVASGSGVVVSGPNEHLAGSLPSFAYDYQRHKPTEFEKTILTPFHGTVMRRVGHPSARLLHGILAISGHA